MSRRVLLIFLGCWWARCVLDLDLMWPGYMLGVELGLRSKPEEELPDFLPTGRRQVGGDWALEIESFLGPVKWHRADRRVPFGAQKT